MVEYNANSPRAVILVAVFGSLAGICVILRFVARSRTKAHYGADDWYAVGSLFTLYGWMALLILGAQNGSGYELATLPPSVRTLYLKALYAAAVVTPLPITLAKFSILYLYRRMFYNHKRFRIATTIVGVLCLFWFIAATIGVALKCIPVQKSWNPMISGTCYSFQVFMVAIEVPNSVLDFVIVGLPVDVIKGLKLPLRHKIALCFVFVLGGFVGIIGFIRIALVYKKDSISLNRLGIWLLVQLAFATICACLPTYRPLLPKGSFMPFSIRSLYSSLGSLLGKRQRLSTSDPKSGASSDSGSTTWPQNKNSNNFSDETDKAVLTKCVGGGGHHDAHDTAEKGRLTNAINVKTTYTRTWFERYT